jgi:hypothetical protein
MLNGKGIAMQNESVVLLTIVTESSIEAKLIETIKAQGAQGYTITDARGEGSRGLRSGSWGEESNIRVEVLCSAAIAEKIESTVQAKFYKDFAMVMYNHPVNVLRPDKF